MKLGLLATLGLSIALGLATDYSAKALPTELSGNQKREERVEQERLSPREQISLVSNAAARIAKTNLREHNRQNLEQNLETTGLKARLPANGFAPIGLGITQRNSDRPQPQFFPNLTVLLQFSSLAAANIYSPKTSVLPYGYIWPARGTITSGFGWGWGRMHNGIDVAAPIGTPIVAAAGGLVIAAEWHDGGYGNLVKIQHPDGSVTLYAHNQKILVCEGQAVAQGELIAEMGSTGYSTGPHLHFEVHLPEGEAVNPMAYLPGISLSARQK